MSRNIIIACLLILAGVVAMSFYHPPMRLMPAPEVFLDGQTSIFPSYPSAVSDPEIKLFYATNRLPVGPRADRLYAVVPGRDLHTGVATVRIGEEGTTWDKIYAWSTGASDDRRPFLHLTNLTEQATIDSETPLTPEATAWFAEINAALEQFHDKDIIVYVHGANTTVERAAGQAAQLHHFTGRNSIVLLFVWPTAENFLRYSRDMITAFGAAPHLARLIELLDANTDAEKIDVFTYSAGGTVGSDGLAIVGCSSTTRPSPRIFRSSSRRRKTGRSHGPFGTYDKAQLQRGLKIYKDVCAACHSMNLVAFRTLEELGYSEEQVKAFAADYTVQDGPNDAGEMFERPGIPSDYFPSPFPNVQAAAAANGGAAPPDFSLLAKARGVERGFPTFLFDIFTQYAQSGPDYIHSLLTGYGQQPPAGMEIAEGTYYNPYFIAGKSLTMPPPLPDGEVTYDDGAPQTVDQYSKDVSAFMMWAAEPHLEDRKKTGFRVIIFFVLFGALVYLTSARSGPTSRTERCSSDERGRARRAPFSFWPRHRQK